MRLSIGSESNLFKTPVTFTRVYEIPKPRKCPKDPNLPESENLPKDPNLPESDNLSESWNLDERDTNTDQSNNEIESETNLPDMPTCEEERPMEGKESKDNETNSNETEMESSTEAAVPLQNQQQIL